MKTSKLALIGVILATLVSVSSGAIINPVYCQISKQLMSTYIKNVAECMQTKKTLVQCAVENHKIMAESRALNRICLGLEPTRSIRPR